MTIIMTRLLQRTPGDGEPDIFEFLGFVAWYLFLVVCCIVPTACAYRRRRMAQQAPNMQRQTGEAQIYFHAFRRPSQERQQWSLKEIQDALVKTTMQVEDGDLVRLHGESCRLAKQSCSSECYLKTDSNNDGSGEEETKSATNSQEYDDVNLDPDTSHEEKVEDDIELGGMTTEPSTTEDEIYFEESEREFSHLQLPAETPNGNRMVPSACAICLCPYEVGDEVTWSPEEVCQHAFHRDCIVSWLAKKSEHLCPCCRQCFCEMSPSDEPTLIVPNTHNDSIPLGGYFAAGIVQANSYP